MRFESLIAPKNPQTTKTAAATDNAVQAATKEVTASVKAPTPVPSGNAVVDKLAADLVASNRNDEAQHAIKMGKYLFQGFLEESNRYEAAAAKLASDKAAEMAVTAEEIQLIRMLREDPDTFMQRGMAYAQSKVAADKEAEQAYNETVNETISNLRKLAAQHYAEGYSVIGEALT